MIVRSRARWGLVLTALLIGAPVASAYAATDAARAAVDGFGRLLDRVDRALVVDAANGLFRAELSGLFDLETYYVDQRPPGLVFESESFVNPRLSLFLDARLGSHLYSFVQLRADRGFDPGATSSGAVRFDEYFLRWTPLQDPRLNLQVGKFATLVGNWVPRHDSWNNPFVNAPLPYENVITVSDVNPPADRAQFLGRRNIPDRKREWLTVIWGPSYTTGAALFGHFDRVDWGVEVKNAALGARPAEWDARVGRDLDDPTASARVTVRPNAAWSLGTSFSHGPYLAARARAQLPAGRDADDFAQTVVAGDASFAWRHLQLWAEVFASRFEVPTVGDADTVAYYLEGRWKLGPALFAALRWNQQLFGEVHDGTGRERVFDRDAWRIDTALGYRVNRHLQAKVQYAYTRQRGRLQQGEQLLAAQVTVKF